MAAVRNPGRRLEQPPAGRTENKLSADVSAKRGPLTKYESSKKTPRPGYNRTYRPRDERHSCMSKRIAIVEDDPELSALIEYNLTRQGYDAQILGGSSGTLKALELAKPDLILLD